MRPWPSVFPLLLLLARPAPALDEGKVGLVFDVLPEGLVVEAVLPGRGAEVAGLVPGALIERIDGEPAADARGAARQQLVGAPGSTVRLEGRLPLEEGVRSWVVERGLPAARAPGPEALDTAIRRFQAAARRRGRGAVKRTARSLLRLQPEPGVLADRLGGSLRGLVRREPEWAREVALIWAPLTATDPVLAGVIGEIHRAAGDPASARPLLAVAVSARVPDVRLPGGGSLDLGGAHGLRAAQARALWELGEHGAAIEVVRALAEVRAVGPLRAEVGMAQRAPGQPLRAPAPQAPAVELDLFDGSRWTSGDQRGRVVVLSFWASWCGPCEAELPALAGLYEARGRDFEVLAVSLDQDEEDAAARAMAARLGLPFAVGRSREVGRAFEIEAMPTTVVLGPDGGLLHRAQGFGPQSMGELARVVDGALAPGAPGVVVGEAWGRARPVLRHHRSLGGLGGALAVPTGGVLLGREGVRPVFDEGQVELAPGRVHGGAGLAWLDGPLSYAPGRHWLRATALDGTERWLRTLPGAVRDVASEGGRAWVAMDEELVIFDASGAVLARAPGAWRDLSTAAGGEGIWATDGITVARLAWRGAGVTPIEARSAPGAQVVGPSGQAGGPVVAGLWEARLGPERAPHLVSQRADDGAILVHDAEGALQLLLELEGLASLSVGDVDGDEVDELLAVLAEGALLVIEVALPEGAEETGRSEHGEGGGGG